MNYLKIILTSLFFLLARPAAVQAGPVTAEALYQTLQDRIYQIQVIDLASNKKSSIGSGFQITEDGLIATNYHVVSEYIHAPEQYRVEYQGQDGRSGQLTIQGIDIIHDLAVLKGALNNKTFLPLSLSPLSKGTRIFAIGNPHDLGMSIISGIFNGLLEKSLYEKILFSGALNPGMSGGPAINEQGNVIGINVSTAGNDLSFLVPVKYLDRLVRHYQIKKETDFASQIEQQVFDNQKYFMEILLSSDWKKTRLGDVTVVAELTDYFKCWGKTDDDSEQLYEHTYTACASPDSVFISQDFDTGTVDFRYDWFDAEALSRFQFYNIYSDRFAGSFSTNSVTRDDVGNYQCNTGFVKLAGHNWKIAQCFRKYKNFKGLFDVSLTMASIDYNHKGLLVNMNMAGVEKKLAIAFSRKYMESIQWQN
ncbi:MAG: serine protease [Gammaproteobacteria bacterium]|nr:serine protease [Gammaproteobacteria bacterium]